MADVRLNELPVLAVPTDGDILHALDDADDRDKQLTMAAVRTFAQAGTATAAQGALAATALQPGSVNLGTAATASTRTVTNTAGTPAVLPTFNTAAGLVPGTTSGTTNFLRADGTWAAPPAGGGGGVSAVSGTVPIDVATGTTTPLVSIRAATTSAAGSMSGTDKTRLDGMQTGATANSTDAQLRDRGTHTGTQLAATISDFSTTSRAQTEAMLTAGTNVTLTPSGSGATRSIQISATAGGGGVSVVTGTAPIVSSGGGSPAISIVPATTSVPGSLSAADKTKLDTLTAGANGTVTGVTGTAPIVSSGGAAPAISINPASGSAAGSMSLADFTKLAGVATGATANSTDATLLARANHTGSQTAATISDFTASSRAQVEATLTAGTNVTLTPSGTGATRSIQISATAGGGGVAVVTGTAPIVSSGGGSPAISIVPATTSVPGSMSTADKTKLDAITGTNTGDNSPNSLYSGLVSNATHTGDATGATALTLATVNSNVGAFGSATQVATFTINAKGLTTAAANVTVTPAWGSVTGTPTTRAGYGITDAAANGAATGTGITMSTARLLGRSTAATGAIEEITLGTNLSFTGTTLNATGGGGGVAQVTATAPLVVSGTATNPDLGILLAASSLLGRAVGTAGVPSAVTLGTGLIFSGSTVVVNRLVTDSWYPSVIGRGTVALGTAAIASGASATVVTVAVPGVVTADAIDWGFNANPNVVTGYNAASTTGCLVITCYPTAGNVNFVVSNPTAASITPGALTLNWAVAR